MQDVTDAELKQAVERHAEETHSPASARDIAADLGRDVQTVERRLDTLVRSGELARRGWSLNDPKGGYVILHSR
jgi:predicted transcriptional regulator